MIAVYNTSPISSLVQIGALSLLAKLFDHVSVPPEVVAELDEGAEILGDWHTAPGAAIVQIRTVSDRLLFRDLSGRLHPGEAAAITLAAETAGAILVIDEAEGRRAAARLGVRMTGNGRSLGRREAAWSCPVDRTPAGRSASESPFLDQ